MSVAMGNTIDNNGPFHRANSRVSGSPARPISAAEPVSAQARNTRALAGEQILFSDSAAMLQRLQSHIEALPASDNERVAAARAAIADGTYNIDHREIAMKLLAMDKELP